MEWILVSSSDLQRVGYDAASKTLYIRFHSGGVYSYASVPPAVYNDLLAAPSKGKYFHANIRPFFSYRRLS